jgi:hypothetical protein
LRTVYRSSVFLESRNVQGDEHSSIVWEAFAFQYNSVRVLFNA